LGSYKKQPVDNVMRVDISKVEANDYNPNMVADREMHLLYISIKHDGYTQPVVTVYDKERNKYIIVDGFHRYLVMKKYKDIYEMNDGKLPIVVLDKDITERMASTVRHNRARGKHTIDGMSNLVFTMLKNGVSEEEICNQLGLEPDELVRLKYLTGFEKIFKDIEYRKAWEVDNQIRIKKNTHKKTNGKN